MGRVVIMGGGPAGLATGMLLTRAGIDVSVLDKDPTDPPQTAPEAWSDWKRPGVAQFRQAHTLLPRGREILDDLLPEVSANLRALGAHEYDMLDGPPPSITEWAPMPGDDRFRSYGARRPTYELAFAEAARAEPGLELRRGVSVVGLKTGPDAIPQIPNVNGVITDTGEEIDADLVVDAAGRRSPLPALLDRIGARAMHEDKQDSRFAYYTRFYRKSEAGDFPQPYVISLLPAGSISVLTLPGDNETWSVTLFATTADKAMRAVRSPETFESVVAAIPARANWIEGEAITDVEVMAGISDRERSLIVDGSPVATGVVPVSDAWACTNPSLGRGITMALMHIASLVPSLPRLLDRPAELVRAWHEITEKHVQPWHRATLEQDRARNREMDGIRTGAVDPGGVASNTLNKEDPEQAAFFAAMLTDQRAFRAGLEIGGLFSTPPQVMGRPEIREIVATVAADMPDLPPPSIPTRAQLESLLG